MSDVIVAPETRDLGELAVTLSRWLSDRRPEMSAVEIVNLDYPRGAGQSHETILLDARWREGGETREQGLVVRIRPEKFTVYPDDLFDEQIAIMRYLSDTGTVRVARIIADEKDPAVLGKPFFVMEKMTGRVPVSIPPYATTGWLSEATPEQRHRLWRGAVEQLALIQTVPVADVPFLAGSGAAASGFAQEWDKFSRFVAWLEEVEPQPVLRRGLERLEAMFPDNRPEGVVWGDARIGNMMFDDNFDVVGVMDWEQPSLGGALQDLAWFCTLSETMHGRDAQLGTWLEGMGTRDETVALWQEICGKSAQDLEWYEDFTVFKMTCTGLRMGYLRGSPLIDPASLAKRLKVA